jgi:hypothetical protein
VTRCAKQSNFAHRHSFFAMLGTLYVLLGLAFPFCVPPLVLASISRAIL